MNKMLVLDDNQFDLEYKRLDRKITEFKIGDNMFHVNLEHYENNKLQFRLGEQTFTAFVSEGKDKHRHVTIGGSDFLISEKSKLNDSYQASGASGHSHDEGSNSITSPIPGKVIKLNVAVGDPVKKGDPVIIVEAMKMENSLKAASDGIVESIEVAVGDNVEELKPLVILKLET